MAKKKKIYKFTGKEGGVVAEATLKKWIQQHEDHHETRAHFFGKEVIQRILNETDCVGIRMYYAIDDQGKKQIILIGANEKGQNLWPSETAGKSKKLKDGPGGGTDNSWPCPPFCP